VVRRVCRCGREGAQRPHARARATPPTRPQKSAGALAGWGVGSRWSERLWRLHIPFTLCRKAAAIFAFLAVHGICVNDASTSLRRAESDEVFVESAASSPAVHLRFARRPSSSRTTRSRVSNGKLFSGVDLRSAAGRRFRDLVVDLRTEYGGDLSIADEGLVRSIAALLVQAEQLQAGIVRGDKVEVDELVRTASEARRLLQSLSNRKRAQAKQDEQPSLASYLSAGGSAEQTNTSPPQEAVERDEHGGAVSGDTSTKERTSNDGKGNAGHADGDEGPA
jgi:hypothetical protein